MPRQIAARVPEGVHRQLRALTAVLNTSQADVLTRALTALELTLPPARRRLVRELTASSQASSDDTTS